ncbi:MAG: hypothetical protein K0R14_724 [Burkholderiales bacterium]|jgi:hypothetical protein|nr:hypothetical protein [Burkholderiales bacterium]
MLTLNGIYYIKEKMKFLKLFNLFLGLYLSINIVYADDLFNNRFKGNLTFTCDFPLNGNTAYVYEHENYSSAESLKFVFQHYMFGKPENFVENKPKNGKSVPNFHFTGFYEFATDSISFDFDTSKILGHNRYSESFLNTLPDIVLGNNFEYPPLLREVIWQKEVENDKDAVVKLHLKATGYPEQTKDSSYKAQYVFSYADLDHNKTDHADNITGSCVVKSIPLIPADMPAIRLSDDAQQKELLKKNKGQYSGDMSFKCEFPLIKLSGPAQLPITEKDRPFVADHYNSPATKTTLDPIESINDFFKLHGLPKPDIEKKSSDYVLTIYGNYFYEDDYMQLSFANNKIFGKSLGSSHFTPTFGKLRSNYMEINNLRDGIGFRWVRIAPHSYEASKWTYFDIGIYHDIEDKYYLGYYDRENSNASGFKHRDYISGKCTFTEGITRPPVLEAGETKT